MQEEDALAIESTQKSTSYRLNSLGGIQSRENR